nr:hypothetical protein [Tanacetum cinerariifolium]
MSSLFADTHNVVAILKKSDAAEDDVTRLQALVDRKKIVILEDVIHEILKLDDAEGVVCLPNEEIFAGLAQMGYEKPSTKLTFYKAFFSSQWKFLIHTLLQSLSAKRTSWNEFSTAMASAEGIVEEQVQANDAVVVAVQENVAEDVANDAIPSLPSHDIPSPSQEQSSPPQQPQNEGIELVVDQVKDADIAETEGRHAAEQAEKQAEIYHLDLDHHSKVLSMQEDDSEVQEVVEVVTTAKLITDVVTAATSQVSAASATISAAKPKINKDIDWDAAIDHVKQKSKNPQYIKRYQVMKKRPQTESEARKNMMIYLKNTTGYNIDFFKGMSYDEICPIFQARFDANMRFLFKSREEMEEEDQERLEVVDDEDDDVFTEATPLARKVPVVDDHIVLINNKPRFKIIKAYKTHHLYISFITLLKNFDREDLENL